MMTSLRSLLLGLVLGVVTIYLSRAVAVSARQISSEGVLSWGPSTRWWVPGVLVLLNVGVGVLALRFGGFFGLAATVAVTALVLLPSYVGQYICPPDLPGCSGMAPLALAEADIPLVLLGLLIPGSARWLVAATGQAP
ncbi:MAG: hypothetical protein ACRDXD_04270 [Acidimicrobiia bacterium]